MSKFSIQMANVETVQSDIEALKSTLSNIEAGIFAIMNGSSIGSSTPVIKSQLKILGEQVGTEAAEIEVLSKTLTNIIGMYKQYEKNIIDGITSNRTGTTTDPNTGDNTDHGITSPDTDEETEMDDEEAALQNAIDILNGISMSTSIDGVVLSVVQYMLSLYDMAADTGLLGSLGTGAGIVGLITGVAADIMYALDNGSSTNALLADLIVDVALFGVGVGADALGTAVGTAVGGPIGAAVGKFVGGLVGNGVSIAMNVDWNGDKEGGVGKDAVSDWIDDQLDWLIGDKEFAAVF